MILAGLDEAGLGPRLGPLCLGCVALRAPEGSAPDTPWTHWEDAVLPAPARRGETRFAVADSKQVHARGGPSALERSVAAFFCAALDAGLSRAPLSRDETLLRLGASAGAESLRTLRWYAGDWPPLCGGASCPAEPCRRLETALARTGWAVAALQARVATEAILNGRFAAGLNKADAAWTEAADLIRGLSLSFPDEAIDLTVDKQGGRDRYHARLSALFPGCWIDVLAEGAARSEYEIRRAGPPLRLRFVPRGDSTAFPVALASMLAKALRERLMAQFNAFFAAAAPGLAPTAGYPQDAGRFLDEIRPLLPGLGIREEALIRQR